MDVVAKRYELHEELGRGANGIVWRAEDRVAHRIVALKRVHAESLRDLARFRREVAALRTLALPGVVRLLDDGADAEGPYLVTELVHGAPFPGRSLPLSWAQLEAPALSLLEALLRIHSAGFLHRDLKPANVLVNHATCRATILDFGFSVAARRRAERITERGYVVGTMAYCAPEQMDGSSAGSIRGDLFSVGVMLYEALSGKLPEGDLDSAGFFARRLTRNAPPLCNVAPGVPEPVARIVDELLARAASGRPHSAADALAALRDQTRRASVMRPVIGGNAEVEALVRAAQAGSSLGLVGEAGLGKTRCLNAAADRLRQGGTQVLALAIAPRALASLEPLLGPLDAVDAPTLERAVELAATCAQQRMQSGCVLLADDLDRFDVATRQLLTKLSEQGTLLWSARAPWSGMPSRHMPLLPRSQAELCVLFGGQDRILHLREDGAALLWQRTIGVPRHIWAELDAWEAAQLTHYDGDRYQLDREAIDKISSSLEYGAHASSASGAGLGNVLPGYLRDIARWLWVSWPHSDVSTLARARGEPAWRIQADVQQLAIAGATRSISGARIEVRPGILDLPSWGTKQRRRAHQRLAEVLPRGTTGRLDHMIRANDAEIAVFGAKVLAAEALAVADQCAREGALHQALSILDQGISAVQATADEDSVEVSLGIWTRALLIAIELAAPEPLDRIRYKLLLHASEDPNVQRLYRLASAAAETVQHNGEAALAALNAVDVMPELELELMRRNLMSLAARRCPLEEHGRVVDALQHWAATVPGESTAAHVPSWRARLLYRRGNYEEAARLHFTAAAQRSTLNGRIEDELFGAAALLETYQLDVAMHRAAAARELARKRRLAYEEAWAEWVHRTAQYRAARAMAPDLELMDAARQLGAPELTAVIAGTEAAIAFRSGTAALTQALANEAHQTWLGIGKTWPAALLRALALHCGAVASSPLEVGELAKAALACQVAELGLQTLALLPGYAPDVTGRAAIDALMLQLPATDSRMDVLTRGEIAAQLLR